MSAVASRKKCPVSWMKVERSAARSRLMTLGVWVMSWPKAIWPRFGWNRAKP
jgi:hypothetical protein